jgi:zona occludens toxin
MIELVTGLPGAGKTLQTLVRVKERAEKEGRVVYYDGIEGIDEKVLPWVKWDGQKWFDLPPNSIIIIDEAQRLFRPRGRTGEPPEHASKLETHRHLGIDLVFITQNPLLIDSHVRRLCERHWHVMRKFGTKWSTIHEFPSGVKENVDKSREGSIRHDFRYPKEAFAWYRSAEVHTHKSHIPARVWVLLAVPLVFLALCYAVYQRMKPENVQARMDQAAGVERKPGAAGAAPGATGPSQAVTTRGDSKLSVGDYLALQTPRVPGLAYTAPAFDEVTRPTEAPYPAACVKSATRCQCYTQQGTRLEVPPDLCESIAGGGFFVAWRGGQRGDATAQSGGRQTARPPGELVRPADETAAASGFQTKGFGLAARPSEGGGAVAVSAPVEAPAPGRARRVGG